MGKMGKVLSCFVAIGILMSVMPVLSPAEGSNTVTYLELAEYWAPVWYQDTDSTDYDADYITNFDFDGNWIGTDNWENQPNFPLKAYVYYWVIETETHWFIGYADFHPRDWEEINTDFTSHENDMEGCLLMIKKDGSTYGQFLIMNTVAHIDFYSYKDCDASPSKDVMDGYETMDGDVQFYQGHHPYVYVEAKGHGIYGDKRWENTDFPGGDGVVYYYTGTAEEPSNGNDRNVGYALKSIDELWERRFDYTGTFSSFGTFNGDTYGKNQANAPWGWDDHDDAFISRGEIFTDPAKLVDYYFNGLGDFSREYIYNPYMPTIPVPGSVSGSIKQGEVWTGNIVVPPGLEKFKVEISWTGGAAWFYPKLTDPLGHVYGFDEKHEEPVEDETPYSGGPANPQYFIFENPMPGKWKLSLSVYTGLLGGNRDFTITTKTEESIKIVKRKVFMTHDGYFGSGPSYVEISSLDGSTFNPGDTKRIKISIGSCHMNNIKGAGAISISIPTDADVDILTDQMEVTFWRGEGGSLSYEEVKEWVALGQAINLISAVSSLPYFPVGLIGIVPPAIMDLITWLQTRDYSYGSGPTGIEWTNQDQYDIYSFAYNLGSIYVGFASSRADIVIPVKFNKAGDVPVHIHTTYTWWDGYTSKKVGHEETITFKTPPEFIINAIPEKNWYDIDETAKVTIDVTNNRDEDTEIWLGTTFKDPEGNEYDIPLKHAEILKGETKSFDIDWAIPNNAPLGRYEIAVNCWKDAGQTDKYTDDLEWEPIFYVYNLDIVSPKTSSPAIVGDPGNPTEFNAKVTGLGELDVCLLPTAFEVKIGGKPAKFQLYQIDLNGNYYFKITPPVQDTEGSYDLNISVNTGEISDYDIESNAVIYSTGGNIDVVEVIDRSGSMSGEKIQAAKDSAKLFVDLMRIGDMIGVVSYSSSASVNYGLTKIIPASVPFFSQRDDRWKNDPIIDEVGKVCGTIGNESNNPIGCAMTSTAMVLKYYGVDTDPRELNDWLNKNSGYAKGGSLKWKSVTKYAKENGVEISWIDNRGTETWRFQDDQPKHWNKLKEEIDKGYPVIVEVDSNLATPELEGHWVLVTSFEGGNINDPANYHINDPWDLSFDPNKRLSHYYDSKYDNTFFAMRFYHGKTPSSPTKQNAKNAIDGISAGGSTSIGAGLRAAYNELVNKGDPSHPHSIVLMSDGWHNAAPHPDTVLPDIRNANIKVFTIGLGAGADADLLSHIAHDTGGEYYYSPSQKELSAIYNAIAGVVKAESTVKTVTGSVQQGETITHKVDIDPTINIATFTVTWTSGTLNLGLNRPDGSKVDPSDPDVLSHTKGATYETYTIDNPMVGEWIMEITAPGTSSSTKTATSDLTNAAEGVITNETNNTINDNWSTEIDVPVRIRSRSVQKAVAQAGISYTATVTATTNLTVHMYTDKDKYSLNEPMKIITTLTKAGIPVIGANVNATIERPDTVKEYLSLYDDGKHDDGAALDGVYANYYTNTNVSGSYTITVHASGTASPEEFTREVKKSVYVSGVPAGEISVTPTSWDTGIVHPGGDAISPFTVNSTSTKDETVMVSATDLTDAHGNVIGSENVISMPNTFVVQAGGSCVFYERIYVPGTAKTGNYTGSIVLTSTANSVNIPVTLQVKKLLETDIPNVELLYADPTVTSINVTRLNLSEINETYKPEGIIFQSAYMINSTGAGNFTLRFTNIPNANTITAYKINATNQWIPLDTSTTTTNVTFTMDVGDYAVVFGSTVFVELYTGWNMISLPLKPADLSASSVLATIPNAGGIAYLWNASKAAYDAIYGDIELEPGKAYWISVTGDGTWTPTGSEIHGTKVNLTPGWNMIGVPSAANVSVADITVTVGADTYTLVEAAQNGYIGGIFYSWNTANEEWDATIISDTAVLKPGTGYFANVNLECVITYP